jgi:hypothetical protein
MSYQVQERLGRGAMGVVDLAHDDDGRLVALKHLVLHGSARDMDRARQRIRREAEALARLNHANIVRLIGLVDDGDEIVLVLPYLGGGTLADHVRQTGPLAPGQVELLADTLLDALAAAHRDGVIHRDIKPSNVLFDDQGGACLADFGMATIRDATSGLTATGAVIGTPDYMAPEQARGEPATPASDVFALGATLLFAATGEPPYGRVDPRLTLQRAARGRLAPVPPQLDRGLRRRLMPMLRRDPRRRPSAAGVKGGTAGTVVLPNHAAPAPQRVSRTGMTVAAIGAVAAVTAIISGIVLMQGGTTSGDSDNLAEVGPPSSAGCVPLPYQPCGAPVAPFTDGRQCIDDHADYDGQPANGCEAAPDAEDGTTFSRRLSANLVPAGDVDRYPTPVDDDFQLLCDGAFKITLVAPAGVSMRVDLLVGGEIVDTSVSSDERPATVRADDSSCFTSEDRDVIARVSWAAEARTSAPYELRRSGSF